MLKSVENKRKSEKKEWFYGFNAIKGIISKHNVIINEFNEYVIVLKCKNYSSLKYLISNMGDFYIKEIEVFVYNKEYYASAKFNKENIKGSLNKSILNFIKELKLRENEFYLLNLCEIAFLLRDKVFREDEIKNSDIKKVLFSKNAKIDYQNIIYAKNVLIKNESITFNKNEAIKHQIIGLQMYPSIFYEGFLTEINNIKNIETSTYIKLIDLTKIKDNIVNNEQYRIIAEYINDKNKLYNTCFYIHIWGNDEELKATKNIVFNIANKYHVILNEMSMQQKRAFSAFLPLMNNNIKGYRAIENVDGILPYNEDIMSNFNSQMKYGTELLSNKPLYFERNTNGIILGSNRETKRFFIQKEVNHVVVRLKEKISIIDFEKIKENRNLYKKYILSDNYNIEELGKQDLYKLFKMYCFLCLGEYQENNTIDEGDKEDLEEIFRKIDEKNLVADFDKAKLIFIQLLEKNKILFKKINKNFANPNRNIVNKFDVICEVFDTFYSDKKKYIYIYNIQSIVSCLSLFVEEFVNRNTKSIYMLSSYNDYALLSNNSVMKEIVKLPYINVIDINSVDLIKIDNYFNLTSTDLIHLKDKTRITGMFYSDICEFNYYLEKEEDEDI